MAGLWDFLKNRFNNNQSGGAAPLVSGLQMDMGGNVYQTDNIPAENFTIGDKWTSRIKNGVKNFNLGDALLGKQANPTDFSQNTADENGTISAGISANPRTGGLINDITAGARENFNNSFRGENWANDIGADGRKKGFAYRLGEGLGTIGRFAESPAGRALITGGAIAATGGEPLAALAYGASAAAQNQRNRTADNMFRNQLQNSYGITDAELNNLRGYVNKDDFNTLALNSYRNQSLNVRQAIANAQDNTKRAKLIENMLDNGMISPKEAIVRMAEYGINLNNLSESNQTKLLPYKQYALEVAPQVALGQLGVAQGRLGLMGDEFAYKVAKDEYDRTHPKASTDLANSLKSIKNQLDRFSATFGNVDNPYRYRIAGGASNFLNTLTEAESNFNSQASLLLNKIARDLGGEKGVLSDQDIQRIKESMPTLKDTKKQKEAKMKAIYDLLEDRMNYATGGRTISNQPVKVGKYTVRVK